MSQSLTTTDTTRLAIDLINRPSLTPDDSGCQKLIADRLSALGFKAEHLRFADVDNLWIRHGTKEPLFVFAGHTDVVPTGPVENWQSPPFEATIKDGNLVGRGAADMKGGIAAMIVAAERFIKTNPDYKGSIAFLITSDEEGPALNGTVKVIEHLQANHTKIDYCIVGEPTSLAAVGDLIKNGRRGSLHGKLTIHGKQGHIAYPQIAANPIHLFAPAMRDLSAYTWDNGNKYFQPTSFQISNIHAGAGADNVIPGSLEVIFNFRFSPEVTADDLKAAVSKILDAHKLKYDLNWRVSGQPFLTTPGDLVAAAQSAIKDVCGIDSELSTSGGTSDGRFIAPTGAEVLELGLVGTTIHAIDERTAVSDLDLLTTVYEKLLLNLLI